MKKTQSFTFADAVLERFEPACTNSERAIALCDEWLQDEGLVPNTAETATLRAALDAFLRGPASVLELEPFYGDFHTPERVQDFLARTATTRNAVRQRVATLSRRYEDACLSDTVRPSEQSAEGTFEKAYAERTAASRAHALPDALVGLHAVATSDGFDALRNMTNLVLAEPFGSVEMGGAAVAVTRANHRELAKHPDARVRAESVAATKTFACAKAPVLLAAKRARVRWLLDAQALVRGSNFPAAHRARRGFSEDFERCLESQWDRTAELARRYVRWRAHRSGTVAPWDLEAPTANHPSVTLSTAWDALLAVARGLSPAYADVLREMPESETVRWDPSRARSGHWYMLADYKGGAPLVHAPFLGDTENAQAFAHEMGHACHLTHLCRSRGPFVAWKVPLTYAEIFSLAFEVGFTREMGDRAESGTERELWLRARVEQGLHFLRRMAVRARFDGVLFRNPEASFEELDAARSALEARSYGGAFDEAPALLSDPTWLFDSYQEEMPWYGTEYLAAYLVASTLAAARPEGIEAFGLEGGQAELGSSLARHFSLDISGSDPFATVWEGLEGAMAELEGMR